MKNYTLTIKFCVIFMIVAPLIANLVLYFIGAAMFDPEPLIMVAVFAAFAGTLLGMAVSEDNLV